MSIRAADDNPNAIEFVPDWYKTQEMCNKTVGNY